MQTIVEGLGWPSSKPETRAGAEQWHTSPVLKGSSQRSSEDELRYQTLTLQVVSRHYYIDLFKTSVSCCGSARIPPCSTDELVTGLQLATICLLLLRLLANTGISFVLWFANLVMTDKLGIRMDTSPA